MSPLGELLYTLGGLLVFTHGPLIRLSKQDLGQPKECSSRPKGAQVSGAQLFKASTGRHSKKKPRKPTLKGEAGKATVPGALGLSFPAKAPRLTPQGTQTCSLFFPGFFSVFQCFVSPLGELLYSLGGFVVFEGGFLGGIPRHGPRPLWCKSGCFGVE